MKGLYEIKPRASVPRKAKRSPEVKAVMKEIYQIVGNHWAFLMGYQMKGNKIRVSSDGQLFQRTINAEIQNNISSHKLSLIGWKRLETWF